MAAAAAAAALPTGGRKRARVELSPEPEYEVEPSDAGSDAGGGGDSDSDVSDAEAIRRASAEINSWRTAETPRRRALEKIRDALTDTVTRPWSTDLHNTLAFIIAGRASAEIPLLIHSNWTMASFVWVVLTLLAEKEQDRIDAHDRENRERCSEGYPSEGEFESDWTQELADAALALMRPFVRSTTLGTAEAAWRLLCTTRTMTPMTISMLRDEAFAVPDIFTCKSLTTILTRSSFGQYGRDDKNERNLEFLKSFADKMPDAVLNDEKQPLLIHADEACYQASDWRWGVLLESWLTPCGTRMRLHGAHVVWGTDMAKFVIRNARRYGYTTRVTPNVDDSGVVRMDLREALALVYPKPTALPTTQRYPTGPGKEYAERYDLIIGGIERVEAKHRLDCLGLRDALRGAEALGGVKALQNLVAAYLFAEVYVVAADKHGEQPGAGVAGSAVLAVSTAKRPAAAAAAAAAATHSSMSD